MDLGTPCLAVFEDVTLRVSSDWGVPLLPEDRSRVRCPMRDFDPSQYAEADRRQVKPPVEVESASWAPGRTLDWSVKERQQWLGRVTRPRWPSTVDQKLLILVVLHRSERI
jgi:hypothetical protein